MTAALARPVALLFTAATALAQTAVYIDLSGEWRRSRDDRPEYAMPQFDDRAWESIRLPGRAKLDRVSPYWLRRRVEIPPTQESLALTLGVFPFVSGYEVFVNGKSIGRTGESDSRIQRPRTWDLPRESFARESVIAVRVQPALESHPYLRLIDEGPYLLTSQAAAPRAAGNEQLYRRWIAASPHIAFSLVFAVIGLLCGLAWWTARERSDLLWFGLVSGVRAFAAFDIVMPLLFPAGPGRGVLGIPLGNLEAALMAEFVFAALAIRSRAGRAVAWLGLVPMLAMLVDVRGFAIMVAWYTVTMVFLVFTVTRDWRSRRGVLSRQERALRAVLLVALLARIAVWVGVLIVVGAARTGDYDPRDTFLLAGPFWIEYDDIFWLLVSAALMLLLFGRWNADRRERQRLAGELEAASVIQRLLLPGAPGPGLEAVYLPAAEVGGDFWHHFDEGRLIVAGDVSGKGLKAAMVVALITGLLDRRRPDEPGAVLAELNAALCARPGGGFVTCCVVRLDGGGRATIASAGHPAPYVDGREVELDGGLPLGLAPGLEYPETAVTFLERLTLVSDGVVEAANERGELFGFERTRQISRKAASEIAEAARAWGQNDDITVVTVRRS